MWLFWWQQSVCRWQSGDTNFLLILEWNLAFALVLTLLLRHKAKDHFYIFSPEKSGHSDVWHANGRAWCRQECHQDRHRQEQFKQQGEASERSRHQGKDEEDPGGDWLEGGGRPIPRGVSRHTWGQLRARHLERRGGARRDQVLLLRGARELRLWPIPERNVARRIPGECQKQWGYRVTDCTFTIWTAFIHVFIYFSVVWLLRQCWFWSHFFKNVCGCTRQTKESKKAKKSYFIDEPSQQRSRQKGNYYTLHWVLGSGRAIMGAA